MFQERLTFSEYMLKKGSERSCGLLLPFLFFYDLVFCNPFLSEVTQTPCSNSRPCPDGGPCLEYGGTYLCTCQTSAAELDHKDFYPYGKSLRHLPNNTALCSHVSPCEQLVSIVTNTFWNTPLLTSVAFYSKRNGHICSLHLRGGEAFQSDSCCRWRLHGFLFDSILNRQKLFLFFFF